MNERDFIQELLGVLRELFVHENIQILTDYPVQFSNGIRRYCDLIIFSRETGLYIFEWKHFSSSTDVANVYVRTKEIIEKLLDTEEFTEYTDRVRFYTLLTGISRVEFQAKRGVEDATTLFEDMLLLFADDLEQRDFEELIRNAPTFVSSKFAANFPFSGQKQHEVFISYRRNDSQWAAGRIADYLRNIYEPSTIFFDTRSIDWGDDFVQVITKRVTSSNILLAIIGKRWLTAANPVSGTRRLDDPDDFVRLELSTALTNSLLVIPVLIDDASMPNIHHLPVDLKQLAFKNAGRIRADSFHLDITPLIGRLDKEKVQRQTGKKK